MNRSPVQRFVIDERAGPLPVGTGLTVHHPAEAGVAFRSKSTEKIIGRWESHVLCACPGVSCLRVWPAICRATLNDR